eukprot:TRINITY_DN6834_c0_g1_i1.p1 TRINITY_DN6834_c0_g1~~TRINITY_DN6834_c0_g1_i1.p1  ORF type:complete len:168 (-),score=85.91 TRINITY_DN6834_c0_g1_i1:22-480(-)
MYLIKTEWVDKAKLDGDKQLMTSLRWLSEKRPHPLYRWLRARGINCTPLVMIVCVQFVYTVCVSAPMLLIYQSRRAHLAYLLFVFVACVHNGANHYFEAFAEQYTARLAAAPKSKPSTYSTTCWSLTVFVFFAVLALSSLVVSIEFAISVAS